MIPELSASTINSQLPTPAAAAPDRHGQAAFQRQLDQARDERRPDAASQPETASDEPAEPGNSQAARGDRQTEHLRNQAAAQRRNRPAAPTAPTTPAATDKSQADKPSSEAAPAADETTRQPGSSDPSSAELAREQTPICASPAAPAGDPTLASLLAASQPKAATADPATAAAVAGGETGTDAAAGAGAGLQMPRGTRHGDAGAHERPGAAAGKAAASATSGAAGDPGALAGALSAVPESPAGGAFESKLAQARQSLPADMLRGMTSPTGSDLAALQSRFDPAGATAASAPVTIATVEAPVASQAFAPEFTERISTMIDGGIERAEILVTPKDMGPVRIELTLSGDDARLVFTAAQPETRQAIEQSSALLRSMLAERGLSLGSMDVSQGNTGNPQQARQQDSSPRTGHSPSGASQLPLVRAGGQAAARRGLLDLFA